MGTAGLSFENPPANATGQQTGNASPAMNETLTGTIIKDRHVAAKAPASMCVLILNHF
jgi:hypothetical protein